MTPIRIFISISMALAITACAPSHNTPKREAAAQIEHSIQPAATSVQGLGKNEKGMLTLQKSALGKAFLMSPTIVIAKSSSILDHMQPLVVTFEKSGSRLALFELNLQSFYDALPADKLLQTFDIVSETENEVTFSWTYGLEFLPTKDLTQYSDFGDQENGDLTKPDESVYPAVTSFVRSMSIHDNTLFIDQVSRLRNMTFTLGEAGKPVEVNPSDFTVQMHVRLTPYRINSNFKPKESELKRGIGFFEQFSWDKATKRKVIQAKRWDLSPERGPLVYAISKDTPAEYVETLKEGILYWNRVLGREAIQVETGVDPKETPRDRRILVHWIDWEDAGFARAGMQSDPFTGEMLGANVYMTSVFGVGGEMSARQEGRTLHSVMPAGFRSSWACHRNHDFDLLKSLPAQDTPSTEIVKQVAKDYIRSTVAHEVGHTLGIRHNFAGTLKSQIADPAEQRKLQNQYLAGKLPQGAVTSSTVMDYDLAVESGMLGARIVHQALPYDIAAMKWATTDAIAASLKAPPFCTDGQLGKRQLVVGCQQHDSGRAPLATRTDMAKVARDNIGARFGRLLISYLKPLRGPEPTLAEFPELIAEKVKITDRLRSIATPVLDLRKSLQTNAEHLATRLELGSKTWINEAAWSKKNSENLSREWQTTGGLAKILENALPFENGTLRKGWLLEQVDRMLATEEGRTGVTLDGAPYELTADEREVIRDVAHAFAKHFENIYMAQVLALFNVNEANADDPEKKDFPFDGNRLAAGEDVKVATLVQGVLSASDDVVNVTMGEKTVAWPVARHILPIRMAALKILNPKYFGKADWAKDAREKIAKDLKAKIASMGVEGADLAAMTTALGQHQGLSAPVKAMMLEDLQLLKLLESFGS